MNYQPNIKPIPGTKRIEYTCIQCGIKKEGYASGSGLNKYCSKKCTGLGRAATMSKKVLSSPIKKQSCEICKNEFKVKKTHPDQRFCSKACAKTTYIVTDPIRKCEFCDTSFLVTSNNREKKYCSVSCSNRHRNTGKTLIQLKEDIGGQRKANTEVLNAVKPEQLKNAQFITEANTEPTVTVKKSDVYKFQCKTCYKIVVRYFSRGKPVPRFCSKKCTRWLGDIDRKPRDASSRTVTDVPETYAQVERSMISKLASNIDAFKCLMFLMQMGTIIFLLSRSSNLSACEKICNTLSSCEKICKSPRYDNLRLVILKEYVVHSCETDITLPLMSKNKPPQRQPSPLAALRKDEK